jgi:hypothetical protein
VVTVEDTASSKPQSSQTESAAHPPPTDDELISSATEETTGSDHANLEGASAISSASSKRSVRLSKPIGKFFEILFTATVAAILTVATTMYLQRNTAPQLSIDYSWCLATTQPYQVKSNDEKPKAKTPIEDKFISFLVDLKTQSLVPYNTLMISIRSDKPNSYVYKPDQMNYVGRMVVENSGKTTATNVRIGLSYLFPSVFEIKVSPNVRATLIPYDPKQAAKSGEYWPYRNEIQIDDLPPNQKAFITISWKLSPSDVSQRGEVPQNAMYYVPEIIYFSSHEVLGKVRNFVSNESVVEVQGKTMSETMPPFYATSIVINKPVQMKSELLPEEKASQILQFHFRGPAPDNPSAPDALRP